MCVYLHVCALHNLLGMLCFASFTTMNASVMFCSSFYVIKFYSRAEGSQSHGAIQLALSNSYWPWMHDGSFRNHPESAKLVGEKRVVPWTAGLLLWTRRWRGMVLGEHLVSSFVHPSRAECRRMASIHGGCCPEEVAVQPNWR